MDFQTCFCESQASNAKVDQGQRSSASNIDAATYDCPESMQSVVIISPVCREETCKYD